MSTATIAFHAPAHDRRRSAAGRPAGQRQAPTPQSAARPQSAASVRLTRRGRLVILLSAIALVFAAFTSLGGPAMSTDETHHAAAHTVVVGSGETLWDIAQRIAPDKDPRTVIAEIVDLNTLPDAGSIRIGQELYVPKN
jgi:Tfp pilus assembly protein FimV